MPKLSPHDELQLALRIRRAGLNLVAAMTEGLQQGYFSQIGIAPVGEAYTLSSFKVSRTILEGAEEPKEPIGDSQDVKRVDKGSLLLRMRRLYRNFRGR